MPAAPRLAIAQVTPFAWEAATEVNEYVARISHELAGRGHACLIIAPSQSEALVRDSRRALRLHPEDLLDASTGEPVVLGVGEVLPFAPARRRAASLPVDVARTIEEALSVLPLDIVAVHEPFAPSASSVALRHSRALNVGSFHAPTERILSTQLTGSLSRLLFARMDARIASYAATRALLQRFFPGEYTVITPGADPLPEPPRHPVPELAMLATEERAALRIFLRALRALPGELEWHATVWSPRPTAPPATLSRLLRDRITFVEAPDRDEAEVLAAADIAVFASDGVRATPGTLVRALGAGAVPVAPRLPVYEEVLSDGDYGLMFEPGEVETLTAHLERLIRDPQVLERSAHQARRLGETFAWSRVAGELERVYLGLAARRRDGDGDGTREARSRHSARPLIDVDLHMHTDHSSDCATPVEVLLAQARSRGLGAIAVTDHNEISGALDARAKADGVKVIVGEEIKTAEQGEVIGLFIEEKIPRGLSLQETIAEIKRQGGIVYVPHPFDRMHSVPDYEHLLAVIDDVDAIEVFNPRIAISEFNEEAVRFAAKYRIPAGAGSDAHVPQGLGSVRIRMRDFDGPEEFLDSLRDADIIRNPASLLYVQALKFLQTKALPGSARRASRERRVRRATGRNS
ncbi:MAG: PHP-associated domain-containing protein [Solirubrobacteraceae bacterium]